jgi:hypothetical protein
MSRAHRTTGVRDDAIIAFILLCLIGLYLFGAIASAVIFAITAVAPQGRTLLDQDTQQRPCAAHRYQHRQAAGPAPQAADLSVVVGAVDAGVMMRAMMLWLLLHYQRILGLRNARGYCARMSS